MIAPSRIVGVGIWVVLIATQNLHLFFKIRSTIFACMGSSTITIVNIHYLSCLKLLLHDCHLLRELLIRIHHTVECLYLHHSITPLLFCRSLDEFIARETMLLIRSQPRWTGRESNSPLAAASMFALAESDRPP